MYSLRCRAIPLRCAALSTCVVAESRRFSVFGWFPRKGMLNLVKRRTALLGLSAGVLAAGAAFVGGELSGGWLRGEKVDRRRPSAFPSTPDLVARPVPSRAPPPAPASVRFPVPGITPVPIPHGTLSALPGPGNALALTVDDGVNSEVVRRYTEFAALTGMRLTFFINGSRSSWTDNAKALRPLVDSGQVQIGNHTWSHPDLTKLSTADVKAELLRNHDFIQSVYGVDARPYYRPPFGFHSPRVDAAAADLGYATPVLWYGSLSDSGLITPQQLCGFADRWILPQHIVIGHANYLPVTECFDYLTNLIRSRKLQPVTLNDYFAR